MKDRSEINRIIGQTKRAYNGDSWHGTNLEDSINSVQIEKVFRIPYPGGNSIWRLVMHLSTWYDVAIKRLDGTPYDPPRSDDFPDPETQSEEAWESAKLKLADNHKRFLERLAELSDGDLELKVAEVGYPTYVLLHGIVQHLLYHAGQIAVLSRI